ncbi:MAG: hypothetical protein BTN85_0384 [Candidatus Methanohalarchaeum thermophilum]|uniref:Amphi-Trp domain-containing protein n=1 Tax=Methanohalarchaeum thermophilum TaxID=1903181 RepID=A0A1Q6DU95_METT1|nr:MAG: hypothetical protein BTN85_0384 [Candidatus Methanohalarchaeum thermophilum]
MEVDQNKNEERKVVEGNFSQEIYIDREELAEFLSDLVEEIKKGNSINIKASDWEIPFKFRDKVELEIEHEGDELEIEMEFKKDKSGDLSVE